jgi:hypothetical protein
LSDKPASRRPQWTRDPIALSTTVIAAATVVNLFVSVGLYISTARSANTARKVFEAANRPYLGVNAVNARFDSNGVEITLSVRNYGTAPAEESDVDWDVMLNGAPQFGITVRRKPTTLFPGEEVDLRADIGPEAIPQIINGNLALTLVVRASYKGPDERSFKYTESGRYNPKRNAFILLGPPDK